MISGFLFILLSSSGTQPIQPSVADSRNHRLADNRDLEHRPAAIDSPHRRPRPAHWRLLTVRATLGNLNLIRFALQLCGLALVLRRQCVANPSVRNCGAVRPVRWSGLDRRHSLRLAVHLHCSQW